MQLIDSGVSAAGQ